MSFNLPYLCKGRQHRRIEMPDCYLGFFSSEDASQIRFGLKLKHGNEPVPAKIKQSAISLARYRKEQRQHD